jgi:predicted amidophosphoribosyltransferase
MPVCEICRNEYQRVASLCPNCGAPLTALAARMREAQRRPLPSLSDEAVILPELEDSETEA